MNLNLKNNFLVFSVVIASLIFSTSFSLLAFADGPPEPISDLIAIPGNGEVHLIWTAPYNNEVPIQNYKVIMWETGTDVITTYPNLSTSTKAVIKGLTNDVSYSFKVIAKNSRGESGDSNIVSAKPTSIPGAFVPDSIIDLKATRGDGKILLSWTPPYNGGKEITSYKIFYWEIGSGDIKTKTLTGKTDEAQITDLKNEVSYRVKVVAINSVGHGPDSNIVSATPSKSTVAKAPNEVRGISAIASDGQVLVTWIKPSENGSPIKNYKIIVSETGSSAFTTYTTKSTDTQYTITGLKNGVKYTFKVIAINSIGESRPSSSASATPERKAVSIEVSNLRVTGGDGKATLNWSIDSEKLEKVTGFRIREYTGGSPSFEVHDFLGKTTSATIIGLTNGVSYGFSVVVVTNEGLGPSSNIVNVIPKMSQVSIGAPSAINDLKATAGTNQVTLTWSKPNDNGNPITGYNIQQTKSGESFFTTIPLSGPSTNSVITGLTNGVNYSFKVMAINSAGIGPASNGVSAIPGGSAETKITIPSWIKINAQWWSQDKISDLEYVRAIEYLINEGIIKLK